MASDSRRLTIVRFLSLLFGALALAPALAHLLELPGKIHLSRNEYLVVQQIYRGWALLGIVVFGALLSTLALTILVRRRRKEFALALFALLCLIGAQVVFWVFTFPTNQETSNWIVLPEHWESLRAQWEYSHAVGALLNLTAFISLICSVLAKDNHPV
jgi:ABC-type cobalamin transport system permease subunit